MSRECLGLPQEAKIEAEEVPMHVTGFPMPIAIAAEEWGSSESDCPHDWLSGRLFPHDVIKVTLVRLHVRLMFPHLPNVRHLVRLSASNKGITTCLPLGNGLSQRMMEK